MKKLSVGINRIKFGAVALVTLASTTAAMFAPAMASAAQVQTRSIKMSSSTPGATAQTYTATFNAAQTYAINGLKGMVLDFCTTSPLIDDTTCTPPTGFNAGTTASVTGVTATWTYATLFSGGGIAASSTTGNTVAVSNGATITWTLTNVTNPTTTCSSAGACTFYARLTTWSTTAGATGYTHGASGYLDFGGFALSTTSAIAITARVMESLQFCVYTTTCGDTTAVELGTGTAGSKTIDGSTVYTGNLNFGISTNALTGAAIVLKATSANNGVPTSGGNTIPAVGGGTASGAIVANTAAFGVLIGAPTATTGTINRDPDYSTSTNYGFITAETGSANGSPFANTNSQPVTGGTAQFTYGITAGPTTPAGIYTSTQQLIATGTF
jgi:hypothetical protein